MRTSLAQRGGLLVTRHQLDMLRSGGQSPICVRVCTIVPEVGPRDVLIGRLTQMDDDAPAEAVPSWNIRGGLPCRRIALFR
jgi:hypothetical protein